MTCSGLVPAKALCGITC